MQTFTFEVEPFTGYSESSETLEPGEFSEPAELRFELRGHPRTSPGMSGGRALQFRGVRQHAMGAGSRGRFGANVPAHGYSKAASPYGQSSFGKRLAASPSRVGAAGKMQPSRFGPQPGRFPPGQDSSPGRSPFAFAYPSLPLGQSEPTPASGAQGSEYVRWVQDALNRIMDAQLPMDGIMTSDVRSAISNFQQQSGLPVTGIVGPDTERALLDALAGNQPT
jgi:hypothetical protein